MNSLGILLRHFGFTLRELGDVLNVSHALLAMILKGQRNPSGQLRQTLEHPLLSTFDMEYVPDETSDQIDFLWLKAQLAVTQAQLLTERNNWALLKKKKNAVSNILYHTNDLETTVEPRTDLIADWWLWQRSRALLWLQLRRPTDEWAMERKINQLEQDIIWLNKKMAEQ